MSRNCKQCGHALHKDALFCTKCGQKSIELVCGQCGNALPEDAKFCVYCGQAVEVGKETDMVLDVEANDPTLEIVPQENKYTATNPIATMPVNKQVNHNVLINIVVSIAIM